MSSGSLISSLLGVGLVSSWLQSGGEWPRYYFFTPQKKEEKLEYLVYDIKAGSNVCNLILYAEYLITMQCLVCNVWQNLQFRTRITDTHLNIANLIVRCNSVRSLATKSNARTGMF